MGLVRLITPSALGLMGDELRTMGSCCEVPWARRETVSSGTSSSSVISTMAEEGIEVFCDPSEGLGEPTDDISYTMHYKPRRTYVGVHSQHY